MRSLAMRFSRLLPTVVLLGATLVVPSEQAAATHLSAGLDPVYLEDFVGETAFPTTPELDSQGLGRLFLKCSSATTPPRHPSC